MDSRPSLLWPHVGPEELRFVDKTSVVFEQVPVTTLAAFNVDAKPQRHLSAGIDRRRAMQ